jgi:hypothetical protein
MASDGLFDKHRLLLFYKGDISALVLFAQADSGSVCFPSPLPPLSEALPQEEFCDSKVAMHPSVLVNAFNQLWHLDNDLLQAEAGFREQIDAPGGIITVHMVRFKLLDPPHTLLQSHGSRFRTLTELRGRPPAEMELLRRAYVKVMEG